MIRFDISLLRVEDYVTAAGNVATCFRNGKERTGVLGGYVWSAPRFTPAEGYLQQVESRKRGETGFG